MNDEQPHAIVRWYVTPSTRQPVPLWSSRRQPDWAPSWPVYGFDTFGEAWEYLIRRWGRHYEQTARRYRGDPTDDQDPTADPPTQPPQPDIP